MFIKIKIARKYNKIGQYKILVFDHKKDELVQKCCLACQSSDQYFSYFSTKTFVVGTHWIF